MNSIKLNLRGTYWKELTTNEKSEILEQMPGLKFDRSIEQYRFFLSNGLWVIVNAMQVPLRSKRMRL